MIQQDEPQSDQDCDLLDVGEDSEPDYGVMAIDVVQIINVELLRAEGRKPRSLSIQLRSRNTFWWSLAVQSHF